MKYVVVSNKGYLTARRKTGKMYESRTGWSEYLDDAKIFNTKSAATNSANQCPDQQEFSVVRVKLTIIE